MTDSSGWATVGDITPEDLRSDLAEAHWAAQLIAAAGQAYAQPREDDSHRAMAWDHDLRAFVSAPFAGDESLRIAVRPRDLTACLLGADGAVSDFELSGRSLQDGYDWLSSAAADRLGADTPPAQPPEYDMPTHPIGKGAAFGQGTPAGRLAVEVLYDAAATMLTLLVSSRADASAILCWPHHFDLATLLTLGTDADGVTQTVGVGLAPHGGGLDDWYWYVSPYPYPPSDALPELEGPGHWHTEGWTGAVLPGDAISAADASFREAVVRKFLDVSVEAATRALRGG